MTASVTFSPRYASASPFSFWRIIALISGGLNRLVVPEHDDDPVGIRVLLDLVRDEVLAVLDLGIVPAAPHEALDAEDRVLGVRDRLALRDLAHQPLAALRERDDRRGDPRSPPRWG